jgi:hypothetical protein
MSQPSEQDKVLERINKSGFPLQMALEHQVKTEKTGWRVSTHEHHWRNDRTDDEGWIDLVLEKNNMALIVECKRSVGGKWAFLIDSSHSGLRSMCRIIQNQCHRDKLTPGKFHKTTVVSELQLSPRTVLSEYCINAGENSSNGRELLERVAADALSATEAIAKSVIGIVSPESPVRKYCTAIVTTAELYAALVEPERISTADGAVPEATIRPVPYLRFMKQLWSGQNYPSIQHDRRLLTASGDAKKHTVFIINAQNFIDFLRKFEPDGEDWG